MTWTLVPLAFAFLTVWSLCRASGTTGRRIDEICAEEFGTGRDRGGDAK